MMDYLSYRTEDSTPDDGGNALFAAMEYWNGGYILNNNKNAVALKRVFI
jgi:serine/threonine-protein kinase RsbW